MDDFAWKKHILECRLVTLQISENLYDNFLIPCFLISAF